MIRHRPWPHVIFVLVVLALASLACNVTTTSDDSLPVNPSQPRVFFIAPVNKIYDPIVPVYAQGTLIEFHAIALAPEGGVKRLEFRVDTIPVGEVISNQANGQPVLEGTVSWIATHPKKYIITVEGFDANDVPLGGQPERLVDERTIQVVSTAVRAANTALADPLSTSGEDQSGQQQAETTPSPAPTTDLSASGSPIVRIDASPNLHVRQGPGVSYPSVGALDQGELVELVGRNDDGSWWAIKFHSGTAWIFAQLTTVIEGDPAAVPLVAAPPPPAPTATPAPEGPADLVIDTVWLDPATPQAGVLFYVYATVRNAGLSPSPEADALLTFQPGAELSPADPRIPSLQPGEMTTIFFRVTLSEGGIALTGQIEVDIYDTVDEGTAGETNNTKTVTYDVYPPPV